MSKIELFQQLCQMHKSPILCNIIPIFSRNCMVSKTKYFPSCFEPGNTDTAILYCYKRPTCSLASCLKYAGLVDRVLHAGPVICVLHAGPVNSVLHAGPVNCVLHAGPVNCILHAAKGNNQA